jgi:hypothetical protein
MRWSVIRFVITDQHFGSKTKTAKHKIENKKNLQSKFRKQKKSPIKISNTKKNIQSKFQTRKKYRRRLRTIEDIKYAKRRIVILWQQRQEIEE